MGQAVFKRKKKKKKAQFWAQLNFFRSVCPWILSSKTEMTASLPPISLDCFEERMRCCIFHAQKTTHRPVKGRASFAEAVSIYSASRNART